MTPAQPRYRPIDRMSRALWTDERGLSIFLALLVLWIFVLPHFQPRTGEGTLLADMFLTALLLTGAVTVPMRPVVRITVVTVALVAVALRLFEDLWEPDTAITLRLASYAVSAALLAFIVLFRVFAAGQVSRHRILGAIAGYLLIGVTWATLYGLVEVVHPGSFVQNVESGDRRDFVYFSFVTLTTMGYGDITPLHSVARTLAILEALVGQLYPAILIARLVSQDLARSR